MINERNTNVIEDIKTYENNFFNIIFSDPPYALGSKVFVDTDGKMKYKGKAKDFMDKWTFSHEDWEIFFEEAFRTLKYGGFCVLYGMDRQQTLIQYYAVKAGFEVQQSLYWYFLSSMPKAADLSKNIDKREGAEREIVGKNPTYREMQNNPSAYNLQRNPDLTKPSTEKAKKYNGYKYSISPYKQVVETIMVFKKPQKKGSTLDDVYAYENGDSDIHPSITNIDGGRVPTEEKWEGKDLPNAKDGVTYEGSLNKCSSSSHSLGRYPSQLFLDEHCADRLDSQSGTLKSGGGDKRGGNEFFMGGDKRTAPINHIENKRGASRINHIISYTNEEIDLLYYNSKVSKRERNAGLEEFEEKENWNCELHSKRNNNMFSVHHYCIKCNKRHDSCKCENPQYELRRQTNITFKARNVHPTLKPIKLNQMIFNLFKLPDIESMKVYVPFAGTYSEVIGVLANGIKEENLYACELSSEYVEIGRARLEYWKENDYSFKNMKTTRENKKEDKETESKKERKLF